MSDRRTVEEVAALAEETGLSTDTITTVKALVDATNHAHPNPWTRQAHLEQAVLTAHERGEEWAHEFVTHKATRTLLMYSPIVDFALASQDDPARALTWAYPLREDQAAEIVAILRPRG